MAVVSTKILHDGWTGSFTTKEIPTFKVVYLVEVDDPEDGNLLVVDASGIPKIGSAYSVGQDFHGGVRCKSLSTSPVAGTRNLWQVTASYGKPEKGEEDEDDPTDGVTEEGEPTDDPLKFAVSMTMSSSRVTRDAIHGAYLGQVPVVKGVLGFFNQVGFNDLAPPPEVQINGVRSDQDGRITNGRPITNSVFTPFDPPPQVDYNRINVRIKFNTLNSPQRILPYINSVNSKALTIHVVYIWKDEFGMNQPTFASVKVPIYAGRVMGITTSPSTRNGIAYHANELEIEIDKLFTWRLDILDRGYATLNREKTFNYYAPDKNTGAVVTDANVSDDGFANREPVLLDGNGQALNRRLSPIRGLS